MSSRFWIAFWISVTFVGTGYPVTVIHPSPEYTNQPLEFIVNYVPFVTIKLLLFVVYVISTWNMMDWGDRFAKWLKSRDSNPAIMQDKS